MGWGGVGWGGRVGEVGEVRWEGKATSEGEKSVQRTTMGDDGRRDGC